MNHLSSFVAPLNDLVVVEITGSDAATFLHGQLTHDVTGLASDHARLAGYCTAKGRLLASMMIWTGQPDQSSGTAFYALMKADIASAVIKRLSMFVMRAQVTFRLSPSKVFGITFDGASTDVEAGTGSLIGQAAVISAQQKPGDIVRNAAGTWIAAPSANADIARWWFIATDSNSPAVEPAFSTGNTGTADECWRAADIAAGLPWVEAATQDVFIPQTLNLDLIDGISFTKGCYPGQEVVARSHYRGTVKRRMAYGIVSSPCPNGADTLVGTDIYLAGKPDAPCGRIVNAACCDLVHLLMEVQLGDLAGPDFRLNRADGPAIALQSLPYPITTAD